MRPLSPLSTLFYLLLLHSASAEIFTDQDGRNIELSITAPKLGDSFRHVNQITVKWEWRGFKNLQFTGHKTSLCLMPDDIQSRGEDFLSADYRPFCDELSKTMLFGGRHSFGVRWRDLSQSFNGELSVRVAFPEASVLLSTDLVYRTNGSSCYPSTQHGSPCRHDRGLSPFRGWARMPPLRRRNRRNALLSQ